MSSVQPDGINNTELAVHSTFNKVKLSAVCFVSMATCTVVAGIAIKNDLVC